MVTFGGIHVLVAAAAIQGPIGPLFQTRIKQWVETVEVNLIGVMHVIRAVLPQMVERRAGQDHRAERRRGGKLAAQLFRYAASKAALTRLVETVADEVRDCNVQVNCLAPGGTYTHMTDEIIHAGERAGQKAIEDAEQIRHTGGVTPDKQIQLAMFLASERSNHISGKLIHVNDDWKRLEQATMHPDAYTLRRVLKM